MEHSDRLLTPGEVAALFRVDPKTVTRWAAAGHIGSLTTPGGHRRFRESEVRALLGAELPDDTSDVKTELVRDVPRCFKCGGTAGDIVNRSGFDEEPEWMHAYGLCPDDGLANVEETLYKVYDALKAVGISLAVATDAVNEMQNRGVLFRERAR